MAFLPKDDKFLTDYLRTALALHDWSEGLQAAVKGVTLNKEIIGNTELMVLPIETQRKFCDIQETAEESISQMKVAIQKLDQLIYKLIS